MHSIKIEALKDITSYNPEDLEMIEESVISLIRDKTLDCNEEEITKKFNEAIAKTEERYELPDVVNKELSKLVGKYVCIKRINIQDTNDIDILYCHVYDTWYDKKYDNLYCECIEEDGSIKDKCLNFKHLLNGYDIEITFLEEMNFIKIAQEKLEQYINKRREYHKKFSLD